MSLLAKKKAERDVLDARVLAVVRDRVGMTFRDVCTVIRTRAGSFTERQIDRSLQRLRKAGRIKYGGDEKGWRVR